MKGYIDSETGYLCIDDMSEGIQIFSQSCVDSWDKMYNELDRGCERIDAENELLKKMLENERNINNRLMVALGALYDRLDTVKRAHYLEGYSDAAWNCHHQDLNDVGRKLKSDVADFPALLESTLLEVKNIIESK